MTTTPTAATVDADGDDLFPRPADQHLLGLEPHPDDPAALSFVVVPRLCRTDGRFYGGAALAAALAASEAATGRPALWSSTQLIATADLGERIRLDVDVVASGRSIDQTQVRGTVGERMVFAAVGSTATPRSEGLHGTGQVMPRVPPPDECGPWRGPRRPDGQPAVAGTDADEVLERGPIGHHLVSEHREAPFLDTGVGGAARPGHMALWARLTGDRELAVPPSPAALGFLADLIPLAVSRACGVAGAGTSLDNSLRIGDPAEVPGAGEWVLLELDAHVAVGGYGHGQVHLWSPDGRMLATGTQSARLFSIDDFVRRRAR